VRAGGSGPTARPVPTGSTRPCDGQAARITTAPRLPSRAGGTTAPHDRTQPEPPARSLARSLASVAGRGPTRAGGNGGNARPVPTESARSCDGREARITTAPRLPFPSGRKRRERAPGTDRIRPLTRRTGGADHDCTAPPLPERAETAGTPARYGPDPPAHATDGRRGSRLHRVSRSRAGGNGGNGPPDATDPARSRDGRQAGASANRAFRPEPRERVETAGSRARCGPNPPAHATGGRRVSMPHRASCPSDGRSARERVGTAGPHQRTGRIRPFV